jgi:hypothetical protein
MTHPSLLRPRTLLPTHFNHSGHLNSIFFHKRVPLLPRLLTSLYPISISPLRSHSISPFPTVKSSLGVCLCFPTAHWPLVRIPHPFRAGIVSWSCAAIAMPERLTIALWRVCLLWWVPSPSITMIRRGRTDIASRAHLTRFGNEIPCVQDAGQPGEKGEEEVDEEIDAAAAFEYDGERRDEECEEVETYVCSC